MPIRTGGGTGLNPSGFAEWRKGDGTVLWSAGSGDIPDSAILHLDAASLSLADGDAVAQWPDESGAGNDLTEGDAPTFRTNVLNGNPIVRFNGTSNYLRNTTISDTQPATIFIVWSSSNANDRRAFSSEDLANASQEGYLLAHGNTDTDVGAFAGSFISYDPGASFSHVITSSKYDGTTSELYRNGTLEASGDAGSRDMSGFWLGRRATGTGTHLEGDVAEVLVCDTALSDAERQGQEARLSEKWGIAI